MSDQQDNPPQPNPSTKPVLSYSSPSTQRIAATDLVLRWIAAVGCAYLLFQALGTDSFGRRMIFQSPDLSRLGWLQNIDSAARQAAALGDGGNLLVSANSDPTTVSMLHPRAVYALWPTRLYAVPPDTIVLDSAQIGPATRPSDPSWLQQHNVRTMVRFDKPYLPVGIPAHISRIDSDSRR